MTRFVRIATPALAALLATPATVTVGAQGSTASTSPLGTASPVVATTERIGAMRTSTSAATTTSAAAPRVAAGLTRGVAARAASTRGPVSATAGVRLDRAEPRELPAPPKREDTSRNRALIIVGGAGLIVGALIGDEAGRIIMVGGAGVGLYGLYRYLE